MSDYEQLLLDAYKGEVFGDAIFSEMAARDDWREHRDTLQTLANIEARTAAALRPLVAAAAIDVGDEDETRRLGRELGRLRESAVRRAPAIPRELREVARVGSRPA